ncbi:ATP-binding protein [Streptomyces hygroscopicus]|uniref:ATP-binding protein n=1 Tax=Streptomyces hygroscopicus TaxID=1912 RepID=UPI001ABF8323|nr:ATP-binding protein [Streptomyces hygroscopicus]
MNNISELTDGDPVEVGSYLKVYDNVECSIIAIIENYSIELRPSKDENSDSQKVYIIEAVPLGFIDRDGNFERGGGGIAIPPKSVSIAVKGEVQKIYDTLSLGKRFHFAQLAQDPEVDVPVDGDRFFSRHIAVVGSTGSGKSHAMAKIIQTATEIRDETHGEYHLNNSHVVIFDLHSEYRTAFPHANHLGVDSLVLPYWLLNSEEIQDLFIESSEEHSHNQIAILKKSITESRKRNFKGSDEQRQLIHYDSPLYFDIAEVLEAIKAKNEERVDTGSSRGSKAGPLNGKLDNFITRLENRCGDRRLDFLLGEKTKDTDLEQVLRQFTGYVSDSYANVTVIDLSGVPFEVLSLTVSLVSRLLFDYAYYFKKTSTLSKSETPLLVVYEEAHKYVPKSGLSKYSSSRSAIERIAKEGRKYGITAAIVSQRPAEISETIFSQCSNFLAMRLTNPDDQNYVKRLIPDSLGPLTESLPMLASGEALLIGDAAVMPSKVKLGNAHPAPSSSDVMYLEEWSRPWLNVHFAPIVHDWEK